MKMSMRLAAAVLAVAGNTAAKMPKTSEFTVEVYTEFAGDVNPSGPSLIVAERTTSDLLAAAGVRLVWHTGSARADVLGPHVLQMKFIATAPPEFRTKEQAHTLATSRPFAADGTPILLFNDRVSAFILSAGTRAPLVLGHVMAHEIGHMLEGFSHHSASGLMRALWTPTEVSAMFRARFPFAEEDRTLIRLGMYRRMNRGITQPDSTR